MNALTRQNRVCAGSTACVLFESVTPSPCAGRAAEESITSNDHFAKRHFEPDKNGQRNDSITKKEAPLRMPLVMSIGRLTPFERGELRSILVNL
jgi:hypothetical protein